MPEPSPLTLDILERAVAGEGSVIRAITRLVPAGGAGDKLVERNERGADERCWSPRRRSR
jgi:hypothetical protein